MRCLELNGVGIQLRTLSMRKSGTLPHVAIATAAKGSHLMVRDVSVHR